MFFQKIGDFGSGYLVTRKQVLFTMEQARGPSHLGMSSTKKTRDFGLEIIIC